MKLLTRRTVLRDLRTFVQGQPTSAAAAKKLKIGASQLSQVLNNPAKSIPAKVLKKLGYVQVVAFATPGEVAVEDRAAKAEVFKANTKAAKKTTKRPAKKTARKAAKRVAKKTPKRTTARAIEIKKANAKKASKRTIARDAGTGKIVQPAEAEARPETTVVETVDPTPVTKKAETLDVFN